MKGGGKSALKQRYKMAFCRAWFLQAGNIAAISLASATLRQLSPGIGSDRSGQYSPGIGVKLFSSGSVTQTQKKEAAWKAAPAIVASLRGRQLGRLQGFRSSGFGSRFLLALL
jgi:hypothetical protein